jgi:hypothetical protein
MGDKIIVNGKIEPVLRVARRKYRFRLLNTGPTRFYEIYLQNKGRNYVFTFTQISNDGNLLPNPLTNQVQVRIAPAERADIVIDFARFPIGTELFLVNQLVQTSTRRPEKVQAPGTQMLKLIVDRNPPEPDTSQVPSVLRPLRPLPSAAELAALPVRKFNFSRSGGMWAINEKFFNVYEQRATPCRKHGDPGALQPGRRLATPGPHPLRGRSHPQQDRQRCGGAHPTERTRAQGCLRGRREHDRPCVAPVPRLQGQVHDALPQPHTRGPRDDAALGHRMSPHPSKESYEHA